jgi:hypothetical protein
LEARDRTQELIHLGKWPCFFFESDTSGEKPLEEFFSNEDDVDWSRFADIGVIRVPTPSSKDKARLQTFLEKVQALREQETWEFEPLTSAVYDACPDLAHVRTGRSLDDKM